VRVDREGDASRAEPIGQLVEAVDVEEQPEVRHRDVVAVHRVRRRRTRVAIHQVRDQLVAVEVPVDPAVGTPASRAAEHLAIEALRRSEVVDRDGQVEAGQVRHADQCARQDGAVPELPLPERVRRGAAAAAEQAELVRIDHDALDRLAAALDPTSPEPYPEERWTGDVEHRAMAVVAWNAVNFGSGWFPHVAKLPGRSGARTLATKWHEHCDGHGVPAADWLAEVGVEEVAAVFAQPLDTEVRGLLDAFTGAWQELGRHLLEHHGGSAAALVGAAGAQRARLAEELAALPSWDDRHRLGDLEVPLFKRAQIVVSHLAGALAGTELGRFDDLDTLTAFADNLVPHVLKVRGVLVVDPALDARIERGELLRSGERGEVELRAVAVHAVELLVARLHEAGHAGVTAAGLDHRLWQLGQDPAVKARPRHRCRCTYY